MTTPMPFERQDNTNVMQPDNAIPLPLAPNAAAAVEAFQRGYIPIPIRDGKKRPSIGDWTHTRWSDVEQVAEMFAGYAKDAASGVGLLLGEPSGGLVDIDLDHPRALRLRDHFLPATPMQTGRPGRPRSHCWYEVIPDGPGETLPATRPYKLPDRTMLVELRSTGAQTVIPPTAHPTGEVCRWEGKPWGGSGEGGGPAKVSGRKLSVQVALLALGAVLLDRWPPRGSRHEAYLALAGGLLRWGHEGVHPFWERNLPVLIGALADVTHDDDGGKARVKEVMGTTVTRLREGGMAVGFPRLAELVGADHAETARRFARDVEALAGFTAEPPMRRLDASGMPVTGEGSATRAADGLAAPAPSGDTPQAPAGDWRAADALASSLPPVERNPMEERVSTWAPVDLEPYLAGQITLPEPNVLRRTDGQGLLYPGRVNSLYGRSESGKTWVAMLAVAQRIAKGERVCYIDLEDEPMTTLSRLQAIGVGADDITAQFRYVHPEGPLADMQRYRHGTAATDDGRAAQGAFTALLDSFDPTLVIVDGMTSLYGLHGHDTNEATATDVITTWLKRLCRSGRSTVVVIDHTGKEGGAGSSPIGAHHKIAMIQGCALRVDVVTRPMPGSVGEVQLVVYKDRLGAVRAASAKTDTEPVAGVVTIDSTAPGVTRMSIAPPQPGDVVLGATTALESKMDHAAQVLDVADRLLGLFGGDLDREVTTPEAMTALDMPRGLVYEGWANLTKRGIVEERGKTKGKRYALVAPPGVTDPVDFPPDEVT